MTGTAAACAAVTFINPYGVKFWQYLIPALLHPRTRIAEWRPLPLLAWDDFWGFRLLFVLTVAAVALGWKRASGKNFHGLAVLALTAYMGWRSRRHGPFFGVAALAFAGPYYAGAAAALPAAVRAKFNPTWAIGILYVGLAFYVALEVLPRVSAQPLAPVGEDPVREADILSRAGVKGNLATPFAWGSYLAWRLYPNIKISMDGRYEAAYPESTFELNNAFFDHEGDWLKLCRSYKVDFVILDMRQDRLQPEDLTAQGYVLIWKQDNVSALLCLPEHAAALGEAARNLPPFTIDPLDLKNPSTAPLFPGGQSFFMNDKAKPSTPARISVLCLPRDRDRLRLALTMKTWRKWPDLIVDFGLQMYCPWKLSTGSVLYRDIAYLVGGPLSAILPRALV